MWAIWDICPQIMGVSTSLLREGRKVMFSATCPAVPLNGLSTRAASDARKIMVADAMSFKVPVAFFLESLIYIYSASAEAAPGDHVPLFTCSGHMEK